MKRPKRCGYHRWNGMDKYKPNKRKERMRNMASYVAKQKWFKSRVFWKAIFAGLGIISKRFLHLEFSTEEIDAIVDMTLNIVEIILWIYVVYGIRNNPSLKEEL